MITQDGSGVDGGKEKPSLKSTPNGLAEARKIISSRVKGIVLIDQENKYDDRKEEGLCLGTEKSRRVVQGPRYNH